MHPEVFKYSPCYLSQHIVPSSGCAQHAPLFSSWVLLGVQQAVESVGFEQQDDAETTG
jgi:hypothetical protein